jgi:hypothetical protein
MADVVFHDDVVIFRVFDAEGPSRSQILIVEKDADTL